MAGAKTSAIQGKLKVFQVQSLIITFVETNKIMGEISIKFSI